jgi:hypothetical protein
MAWSVGLAHTLSIRSEPFANVPAQQVVGFHGTYTGRLPAGPSAGSVEEGPDSFAVTIQSNHTFTPTNTSVVSSRGKFSSDFFDVVQALLDEPSLRLQAACTVGGPSLQPQGAPSKSQAKPARLGPVSLPCEVSIVVYGPKDLIDNVGEFFQACDMYLQDPKGCDWDVKYCNPHRLSWLNLDDCPMTSELSRPGAEFDQTLFQSIAGESDVLDILNGQQDLLEASQPEFILPSLKK